MKRIIFMVIFFPFFLEAYHIRKAISSDAAQIAHVYYESWHAVFDVLTPYLTKKKSQEHCYKMWHKKAVWHSRNHLHVACDNDVIIGFIFAIPYNYTFNDELHDCFIDKLYVLPEYRRQGIGKLLLMSALKSLRKSGFKKAVLKSVKSNKAANTFYEAMGGILLGTIGFMQKDRLNIYSFTI